MNTDLAVERRRYLLRMLTAGTVCYVVAASLASMTTSPSHAIGRSWRFRTSTYEQFDRPPDVVVLGNSYTAYGIDPAAMEPVLSRRAGRNLRVFNFACSGGRAMGIRDAVTAILASEKRPVLVIIGTCPRDVSGDPDDFKHLHVDVDSALEGVNRAAAAYAPPNWTAALAAALAPDGYVWTTWRRRWQALRDGRPVTQAEVEMDGWKPAPVWSLEKRAEERERAIASLAHSRSYDALYPPACRVFESAVQSLRGAGISVTVYEHAFAPSLRPVHQSGGYAAFRSWLTDVCARQGARLIAPDFTRTSDDDYLDGAHLAPFAAPEYSRDLANQIVMPLAGDGPSPDRST